MPLLKIALPYDVLEAVNMDSYKVQKQKDTKITLDNTDGTIEPMGSVESISQVNETIDPLSKIIKDINDRFGTAFDMNDKVILNSLSEKLLSNQSLEGSIKNNSENAQEKLNLMVCSKKS